MNNAAAVGLSHQQRKRVLAGSDPLVADLILTFDLLDDAVVLLHEDGRIIQCNHAAAVLALPAKATAISTLHTLGPGEPWAAARTMLREYQTQSGCLERETRDAGIGKCWALRLTALAYLGVFPRRLALVIRDITEAACMHERLRERELLAATGTLLAGAAHQVKNAIFGLSATLDAFEARLTRDASDNDYVDNLRAGITQMQILMRDLLDYANPSTGEAEAISLAAVVRRSASGCRALATKMGVEVALDVEGDRLVKASPTHLVRALENLLENAIQHSPNNGTVVLRLSGAQAGEEGLVRLDIIDQGPGFPPESMEKLFTPYFTRRPGGTGLGLTITQKIVEGMGGAIRLSNRAAGGAQVTVALPACAETVSELRNILSENVHGGK